MGLFERMWGFIAGREDAAPALPGPVAALEPETGPPLLRHRHDSVANPWTGLGDASRDKGAVARPNVYELGLSEDELLALHRGNGISRRIVELLPDRAIRKGWSAPDVPTEEEERLHVYDRMRTGWVCARLWGGAAVLMVTEDDVPRSFRARPELWLREPLDLARVGKLHALHVYDAREAWPLSFDRDRKSSNYRAPLLWQLSDEGGVLTVHHSRVLWLRGAERPPSERHRGRWGNGRMPDDSVLQAIWAEIRRLTETQQGGALLAHEIREKVLKVSGLANKLTGDDAAKFKARLTMMQQVMSLLGIMVIGDGDEYVSRSNPATGFKDLSEGGWDALAAAVGWPKVVLRGDAPSGLNTDGASAWQSFHQTVSDFQERNRSVLHRLYAVIYAAQDGPTRGRAPARWAISFRPLDEPPQKEVAEVRKLTAEMDRLYIEAGVYGPEEVARQRFGPDGWSIDLVDVVVPDPDEDAIEAARIEAEAELEEPRVDASSGTFVVVPAVEPSALRAAVEQAIGGRLLSPPVGAHVTVLYLGEELEADALAEVVVVVGEEAAETRPVVLQRAAVRAFPPGPRGVPIVAEFEDAWALEGLHDRLLRTLAHRVTARQHRRYRAHLTLGYAQGPLTTEAQTELLAVDASEVRVPVAELAVWSGGARLASVVVGQET